MAAWSSYQRLPADAVSFETGAPHAGADPLDDQVAFEFGDRGDNDHDGAAQRSGGVHVFAEADELDVEAVEFVQHLEVVLADRAILSAAQTRTTSKRPRRASAII